MKFILALVASCLFSALVAGQTPAPTPPASGPSGPVGPAGPPPANLPPAGARQSKPGPTGPAGPSISLASAPPKIPALPAFDRWVKFDSPAGGFTIKFPSKPVANPGVPSGPATGLLRYATLLDAGMGRYFEVDYFDYRGQLNAPELARDAGINAMTNYLVGDGMQVTERRTITKGNCQISEVSLRRPLKGFEPVALETKLRALFSGDKLYVLMVQTSTLPTEANVIDNFLDSFAVTGGCVDAIGGGAPPKVTKGTDAGTLDAETGWFRFEDSSGISFLLPTPADTEKTEIIALGANSSNFAYRSSVNGVFISVEVLDGAGTPGNTGLSTQETGDLTAFVLQSNLAKRQLVLGECRTLKATGPSGRECSVTGTGAKLHGRSRIFITPTRMFVLTVVRESETTDQIIEDRFFGSVRIKVE